MSPKVVQKIIYCVKFKVVQLRKFFVHKIFCRQIKFKLIGLNFFLSQFVFCPPIFS
jgi:hypothetical protein